MNLPAASIPLAYDAAQWQAKFVGFVPGLAADAQFLTGMKSGWKRLGTITSNRDQITPSTALGKLRDAVGGSRLQLFPPAAWRCLRMHPGP